MKKNILVIFALITLFGSVASAENFKITDDSVSSSLLAYQKGDVLLNAGVSLGVYGYTYFGSRSSYIPPVSLSGELGIHEYISVGAMAGFTRYSYDYTYLGSSSSYRYYWTYISVGPRASFHYLPFLNEYLELGMDEKKFDFYWTVFAGLRYEAFAYDGTDDYLTNNYNYENHLKFDAGSFLGFKYMFNDNLGIFLEGGRHAFGWGTFGLSLKM